MILGCVLMSVQELESALVSTANALGWSITLDANNRNSIMAYLQPIAPQDEQPDRAHIQEPPQPSTSTCVAPLSLWEWEQFCSKEVWEDKSVLYGLPSDWYGECINSGVLVGIRQDCAELPILCVGEHGLRRMTPCEVHIEMLGYDRLRRELEQFVYNWDEMSAVLTCNPYLVRLQWVCAAHEYYCRKGYLCAPVWMSEVLGAVIEDLKKGNDMCHSGAALTWRIVWRNWLNLHIRNWSDSTTYTFMD